MIPQELHDLDRVLRHHRSRSIDEVRVGEPADNPLGEVCVNHGYTSLVRSPGRRSRLNLIVNPNLLVFPEDEIVARIALHDHQHARQLHRPFVMGCVLVRSLAPGLQPMLCEADALTYQIMRSQETKYAETIAYDEARVEAQNILEMLSEYISANSREANAIDDARRRLERTLRQSA